MKNTLIWLFLSFFLFCNVVLAQPKLSVEGNGLFTSPASTNIDIRNTDDNTNALIRFGDANLLKASFGFNGNEDAFKISMGTTLGREDLTISQSGFLGINSLPTSHRFFILHNSTSGTDGAAHLTLEENNTADFARLRFQNLGDDGLWVIASRATFGSSLMNFFHNDGANFANILSLNGDLFRVGIHETNPEAYLHIKQQAGDIDALKLENDDATGGEIWGFQIADPNLELFFQGELRGFFNNADGAYVLVPPPPAPFFESVVMEEQVLGKIMEQMEHLDD